MSGGTDDIQVVEQVAPTSELAVFFDALVTQFNVVSALVLRETRTRFGLSQLGYLWALIEPSLFIGTFLLFYWLTDRAAAPGMTLLGCMATGVVPFMCFRETASRVSSSVSANKGLLFYPLVRPLDLVLARMILELATWFCVFSLIMGGEALILGYFRIESFLGIIKGFTYACLLGAGVGLVTSSLSVYSESVDRFVSPLLRPLLWFSAVFYPANVMPSQIGYYLRFNPVIHAVEAVREAWYQGYDSLYAEDSFPLWWIGGLLLLGLSLERSSRAKLRLT